MKFQMTRLNPAAAALVTAILVATFAGCQQWRAFYQKPTATPLGTISDDIWKTQERNAEMSDFVVHVHDFRKDSVFLNQDGEDHVRSIAMRLRNGQDARVIVERTRHRVDPNTQFKYPVHVNAGIDMRRREMIVRLLGAMGISDADQRVLVAPRLSPGMSAAEAQSTLRRGSVGGRGGRGFGGFFIGGGRF
jgi:hypothetical protein